VGLVLACWAVVKVLRDSLKAFGRRRSRFATSLYLGALSGLCALLLHNMTSFNLHIGANALYFAFLAALLVALSSTRSQLRHRSELPQVKGQHLKGVVAFSMVILLGSLALNIGGLVAKAKTSPFPVLSLAEMDLSTRDEALQRTREAIVWAPFTTTHRYLEARLLAETGDNEEAMQVYGQILQLRPFQSFYLHRAAMLARDMNQIPLAGALLKSGVDLDLVDFRRVELYARWLISQDQRDEAFLQIRRAMELAPQKSRDFIDLMRTSGLKSFEMKEAFPERALAWQFYANYLVEKKQDRLAERAYRKAMQLTPTEDVPSHGAYWTYYKYLEKNKRYDEAVAVVLEGIELFPENANLHAAAGLLYERQELTYRAGEEYRQALLLNSKLTWVRKRLDRL
jgi:tetratricopeptide (TPR) repeat protein